MLNERATADRYYDDFDDLEPFEGFEGSSEENSNNIETEKVNKLMNALFNYDFDDIRKILKEKSLPKSRETNFNNKIACSKFPKDINLTELSDFILPYIDTIDDLYYLLKSDDTPYIKQVFPLILKTQNIEIIEHILCLTKPEILPITSCYNDKPYINNIEIIQLLDRYDYFKNANILYQQMNKDTLENVLIHCDVNVFKY